MTAEDGAFDAPVEVAAAVLDALTERHIVFARARDSAGAWGPFRAVFTPDPSCAASLSPPAQSVAASGGAGSVALAITDGCAWTADTLDTWVTVTTSAGVGPGAVSYQVPPNTGTTSRTAVIVIAGQPLAIDQAGVSPADLRVTAVTVSPSIVAPGSKLSITDTVVNQGDALAGASTTPYYLSSDSQKGAGDLLLSGARTVPSLAAGASSTGTVPSVVVPAATPLGEYHVLACADDSGAVIQANESNNCLASAATIQVTRPDLVVTTVTDPPTAAAPGSTFKIWDTVQNQGAIAATSSLTRFYLSRDVQKGAGDLLLSGSRAVPPLAAGASSAGALLNVTIPSTTPLNTYYVLACADDTATVAETDNANNCRPATTRLQVTRPNLVETAVSNPPAEARRGTTFTVTDTVKNIGALVSTASTTRYYLSMDQSKGAGDILLGGARSIPALAPGATSAGSPVSVTIPSSTPAARYYLLACADYAGTVIETDEANCRASSAQVGVTP